MHPDGGAHDGENAAARYQGNELTDIPEFFKKSVS